MTTDGYSYTRDLLSRLNIVEDELRKSNIENATLRVRITHAEKENISLKTQVIQRKQVRKMMEAHLANVANRLEQSLEEPIVDGEYTSYIHLPIAFCSISQRMQQQKRDLHKTKEELQCTYYSLYIAFFIYCVMYLLTYGFPI
jgi:uncharacterized protein (DUF342 family)